MSIHKINEDRAFDLLRLASRHCNREVREIAADVVETGCLRPGWTQSRRLDYLMTASMVFLSADG